MVGKYLANLNLNKTIYASMINIALEVPEKLQCLKQSACRGVWPNFYTYVIKCVVVSMFKFTVNKATISGY